MSTPATFQACPTGPCPSCGFANPFGFRFCGTCGARLDARGGPQIGGGRPEAERRQLTVLFCDLVGSTHLANVLEVEELRDVIRTFQATCADVVRRYGGTISRFLGDGILVLFGYPLAHEDDAERAVRAALGMVEAVARLRPPAQAQARLAVRIGIATGLVVAGDIIGEGAAEEEAIVGETPNLAGRLHTLALPDTVVIAPRTHDLLGGRFLCADLGARRLKGFGKPVRCWRVLRPRSILSNFQAGGGARAPLRGRGDDMAWLRGLWESAAAGRGRVATLAGEPGIGKSRLAEALCELVGDACIPLRFQCSPHYVNRALHPVIQHIELDAHIGPEDSATEMLEKLSAWLRPSSGSARELALLAALLSIRAAAVEPLPAMSAQRQKQDTFGVILRIFSARTSARPLLLIFEDLHWADPTTLEFLTTLVECIDRVSALAIFTCRPGFSTRWEGPHVTRRVLRRLPREAALDLAEHVAGVGRMAGELLDQVVARADGIPLFIEELTHAVLGLRAPGDGARPLSSPTIPSTLQDSLMARLDQLGSAKSVAQLASAIGREFSHSVLGAITPLPAERLRADLSALVHAGLVHVKGSEHYAFKHVLVQEVAYQTLLRGRRQELHTLIADVLQERFPRRTQEAPELLAHHWSQAGDIERATTGWLAAGERACERSEYSEAVGHLRRGIDLVPQLTDPVRRSDRELALLLALGPVLMMVTGAGTSEVAHLYARALELCAKGPQSASHFAAHWGRWRAAMDHRAGRERADELLHLAQDLGDPALLVQAHHCQWATLYMLGEHEECVRHADEGIRFYDADRHRLHAHLYGGHDPKVCALGERALSCWLLGRLDEGFAGVRLALEWAESLGHVGSRMHAMDYALQMDRLRRNAPEVARQAERMVAFATEQHLAEHRAKGMVFRGWATAVLGDVSGGLAEMRSALAGEEAASTPEDFPLYYEMFAEACERAGRYDEGLDAVRKGFAEADRGRLVYWNAELHRRRGELLLVAGADLDDAEASFERALADGREQGALLLIARAAASLRRLRATRGRDGGAPACRPGTSLDLREAGGLLGAKP